MNDYKGLKTTLSVVRGTQHYAAVIAEVLILLSFAMSGLDVSIGGKLAGIQGLALFWGITFALGIDTSFVLAWVRVRQAVTSKQYGYLWWCIPLALGMSFIVFQPVAIQQLQQSMGITFQQALSNLGIDLNFLVYARSFVAVLLGAILAMTNVEQPTHAIDHVDRTVDHVDRIDPVEDTRIPLEIPVVAQSIDPVERSSAYQSIKSIMVDHTVDGRLSIGLQSIADKAGVSHGTVKKYSPAIKRELGLVS